MTWGSSNWKLRKKIGNLLFRKVTGTVDGAEILHQLIGSLSMFIPLFTGFYTSQVDHSFGFLDSQ